MRIYVNIPGVPFDVPVKDATVPSQPEPKPFRKYTWGSTSWHNSRHSTSVQGAPSKKITRQEWLDEHFNEVTVPLWRDIFNDIEDGFLIPHKHVYSRGIIDSPRDIQVYLDRYKRHSKIWTFRPKLWLINTLASKCMHQVEGRIIWWFMSIVKACTVSLIAFWLMSSLLSWLGWKSFYDILHVVGPIYMFWFICQWLVTESMK